MRTHVRDNPLADRRAFTLIEMLVVVAILAIMATMTVPRLVNNDKRVFRTTIDQVADLLTMYAQRESLGQKVVGIQYDAYVHQLQLLLIDIDNARGDSHVDWRRDFYVDPVKLPRFMRPEDIEIYANGEYMDTSVWPVSSELGQDRQEIEIVLHGPDQDARLILAPYAVAPLRLDGSGDNSGIRQRIDLDSVGRSREDW